MLIRLPLGDSFVDYFMSRDTDSLIIDREVESFNVWLKSETLFHIMRDSPFHNISILGGLWGFASKYSRLIAKLLFTIITNDYISTIYNPNGDNPKGTDQHLLDYYFWPLIRWGRVNATIHDSYWCFRYKNSEPFPKQRQTFKNNLCFIGCNDCCEDDNHNNNQTLIVMQCPQECRPIEHMDWIYC
jgi:hypothetical protein